MERVTLSALMWVACAASVQVFAQEARWYGQIANDVAFGTDRWYTSGVRIAERRRYDQIGERASNRIGFRVTKCSFRGGIELDHPPMRIHRDDAIEYRVQDRG